MADFNPIIVSGQSAVDRQPTVYVQYDGSYLYPSPNGEGSLDAIPGFMFYGGNVEFGTDKFGNVRAIVRNKDGSIPT